MKGSNAIRTNGLTRKYNEKTAVDHLDLTIHEGELFALLGVNGAGKTTTIRMLSCLSSPTEGTAEIFGHDVSQEPDTVKSLIGISTQDTAVAEKLTVEDRTIEQGGNQPLPTRLSRQVTICIRAGTMPT